MSAVGAFADDYVYTATQRLKVTGDNIVANGDFADGLAGWTDAEGLSASTDVWSVEPGVGPNGESAVQSLGATAGAALCNSWTLDPGTYVITYDVKGEGAGTFSITPDAANYADFFLNTDGSLVKAATTEEAPVVNVATVSGYTDEWSTKVFAATVEQGQFLVMHFERVATGVTIANISIRPAIEVYDIRDIEKKIAHAKNLLEDANFNTAEATGAHDGLAEVIDVVEKMIAAGDLDDAAQAEGIVEGFESSYNEYLDASTENLANDTYFRYSGDITAFPKYNRGQINDGQIIGGFVFRGGNWLHSQGADFFNKQIQGSYTNGPGSIGFYSTKLPAGKYYISGEMRNAYCDKNYNYTYTLETAVKGFIGTNEVEFGTIKGEEYVKFYLVAEYTGGDAFEAGFYWDDQATSGTAFNIKNLEIRSFGKVADIVAHREAWEKFIVQYNAMNENREKLIAMIGDSNYPWDQQVLKDAQATWDPYYTDFMSKGWVTADGEDAGVASTEELDDWATTTGVYGMEEPYDKYGLVRGYQYAINAVVESNKIFFDLADAIENAKTVRDDGMNTNCDKETYQAAIDAAQNALDEVKKNTSDETKDTDLATLTAAKEALEAAEPVFVASGPLSPIVNIDFSTSFVEDLEAGGYAIWGEVGQMSFPSANIEDNDADTQYVLGYQSEYTDVLRVGNGTATVMLADADIPTDDEVLRFKFDIWYGNLVNYSTGVELRNAAGERVAGFSLNRYNGVVGYNDFNNEENEGMDLLTYVTGVGSSAASNSAICADNNRSSFDLIVDYKAGTVQGIVKNPQKGTCTGAAMPMPAVGDTKITQFALISNYTNKDRRCWFDNLLGYKYASAADAGISSVAIESNSSKAVYNLQGMKVNGKSLRKGLYIQNGRKFVKL